MHPAETVTVRCRLVGELRRYLPGGDGAETTLELSVATTADELLQRLGIPERDLVIVGVNGAKVPHDTALHDGDEVMVVAAMTGGAL